MATARHTTLRLLAAFLIAVSAASPQDQQKRERKTFIPPEEYYRQRGTEFRWGHSIPATPRPETTARSTNEIRVHLTVEGDEQVQNELFSYVGRELRALGDVVLVDQDADLELELVALRVEQLSLVAVSAVVKALLDRALAEEFLSVFPNRPESLRRYLSSLGTIDAHWVRTGSTVDIHGVARKLVATFDAQSLETARQVRRAVKRR
jgi:hypothetical protein